MQQGERFHVNTTHHHVCGVLQSALAAPAAAQPQQPPPLEAGALRPRPPPAAPPLQLPPKPTPTQAVAERTAGAEGAPLPRPAPAEGECFECVTSMPSFLISLCGRYFLFLVLDKVICPFLVRYFGCRYGTQ